MFTFFPVSSAAASHEPIVEIHRIAPIFKAGPTDRLKIAVRATMSDACLYRWFISRSVHQDMIDLTIHAEPAIRGEECDDKMVKRSAEPPLHLKGLRPGEYTIRILNEVGEQTGLAFRVYLEKPECYTCLPRVRQVP